MNWEKRFDELCGDWEEEGVKYRDTKAYAEIKAFIQGLLDEQS